MTIAINPFAPVETVAEQLARPIRVGHRLLDASDEAALIEYLKIAMRPSPERRARVAAMRRERLSDAQFDANYEAEENGEGLR